MSGSISECFIASQKIAMKQLSVSMWNIFFVAIYSFDATIDRSLLCFDAYHKMRLECNITNPKYIISCKKKKNK